MISNEKKHDSDLNWLVTFKVSELLSMGPDTVADPSIVHSNIALSDARMNRVHKIPNNKNKGLSHADVESDYYQLQIFASHKT